MNNGLGTVEPLSPALTEGTMDQTWDYEGGMDTPRPSLRPVVQH